LNVIFSLVAQFSLNLIYCFKF